MGNSADYRSRIEVQPSAYQSIETSDAIAGAARRILAEYVEQVALVAIRLRFEPHSSTSGDAVVQAGPRKLEHSAPVAQSMDYLLRHLRSLVRKTDYVFLLGETCYFLLPGADEQGGEIVQKRLWEALLQHIQNASDEGVLCPETISIGHSTYPGPCGDIEELIHAAGESILRFEVRPAPAAGKVSARSRQKRARAEENDAPAPAISVEKSMPVEEYSDEDLPSLARKLGIPYLSPLPGKLPRHIQHIVDPQLALELRCCPLGRERNMLTVAMLNPQDRSALDRLQRETGLHIFPVLTHPRALQTALEQLLRCG